MIRTLQALLSMHLKPSCVVAARRTGDVQASSSPERTTAAPSGVSVRRNVPSRRTPGPGPRDSNTALSGRLFCRGPAPTLHGIAHSLTRSRSVQSKPARPPWIRAADSRTASRGERRSICSGSSISVNAHGCAGKAQRGPACVRFRDPVRVERRARQAWPDHRDLGSGSGRRPPAPASPTCADLPMSWGPCSSWPPTMPRSGADAGASGWQRQQLVDLDRMPRDAVVGGSRPNVGLRFTAVAT